jgi:hypothetical protein
MDKADAASAATAARVLATEAHQWGPLVQAEFEEFVHRYAEGERREVGQRRVVGVLAPGVVERLRDVGKLNRADDRATVHVMMPKLRHLLGDGRTTKRQAKGSGPDFVSQLPSLLRNIGEAWLDHDELILLCTSPESDKKAVKVVVDLRDSQSHQQSMGGAVVSMELINPASFTRKGLIRIDRK